MNKKIFLGVLLCGMCIVTCGCTKLISLTPTEESEIAAYSAKIVSKYNVNQKDGACNIGLRAVLKSLDKGEEEVVSSTATEAQNNDMSVDQAQQVQRVSLANALGISGVTFSYKGFEVKDEYQTNTYYMSPSAGKSYLVMKFNIINVSGADLPVDILSKRPKFTATVNNNIKASNELTLMAEDLATFKGTLINNETKELVVIFQFKKEDLQNVQNVALSIALNGATADIAL